MDISKIWSNSITGSTGGNPADSVDGSLLNKTDEASFEKKLQAAMDKQDEEQMKKVCKEFEAIMLDMMYRQMKASVPKYDLIPESGAGAIYNSMLDQELMTKASQKGIGLGDALYEQLVRRMKSAYKVSDDEK